MSTIEMKEQLHSIVDKSSEDVIAEMLLLFNAHEPSTESDIVAYNKEIDKAMKEIDKGNFFTHEVVKERIKKRFENSNN